MPGFDGMGPRGDGPMTGRGMGYCIDGNTPDRSFVRGFGSGAGFGRRYGRGVRRGMGRGFGRGYYGPDHINRTFPEPTWNNPQKMELSKEEQIKILEQNKKSIETELDQINKKIDELRVQNA